VILDEATADIDPRTEALVADALDRLTIGRTLLVVAHRPATARRCDRVVNLDAGRLLRPPLTRSDRPDEQARPR
jgi:ABC-type multidrug transport system fused ATPase/permease subunit